VARRYGIEEEWLAGGDRGDKFEEDVSGGKLLISLNLKAFN